MEGESLELTVTLSNPSASVVLVTAQSSDGSAIGEFSGAYPEDNW